MTHKHILLKQATTLATKLNDITMLHRLAQFTEANIPGRIPVSFRLDLEQYIDRLSQKTTPKEKQ